MSASSEGWIKVDKAVHELENQGWDIIMASVSETAIYYKGVNQQMKSVIVMEKISKENDPLKSLDGGVYYRLVHE